MFSWKKAVGFGLLIWVIMFAVVSAFISFDIYANIGGKVAVIVIAGIIAYLFAANIKLANAGKALGLGVVWVAVGAGLDALVTLRFNPDIFKMRSLWVGYLVVLLAPVVWSIFSKKPSQPTI